MSAPAAASEHLADERIQAYLGTKEVIVLATVGLDGAPLAMPMWFFHDAGGVAMISVADSQKVRNVRRDPRVAVVAETVGAAGEIRGVTVRGRARILDDGPERRALVERLVAKYHPRLARIWGGATVMPASRVLFHVAPERVRSWGLG